MLTISLRLWESITGFQLNTALQGRLVRKVQSRELIPKLLPFPNVEDVQQCQLLFPVKCCEARSCISTDTQFQGVKEYPNYLITSRVDASRIII